jgi:hypothetical protein
MSRLVTLLTTSLFLALSLCELIPSIGSSNGLMYNSLWVFMGAIWYLLQQEIMNAGHHIIAPVG